ncbi:MAG: GNAT family N-acetyltransferase [bacterium]|nr:GNAT family N-acetyltransferase [bacterium]
MRIEYLADYPQHLRQLAEWHHTEWSKYNPGDTVEKRVERMQAHLGKRQVPTTFVALDGGVLMGSACILEQDMHEGRLDLTPWLASVYVSPDFRKRGVGSALVARVEEEARALGVETLYLYTPDRESLYARLGWAVLERREYMGDAVVIMEKGLITD